MAIFNHTMQPALALLSGSTEAEVKASRVAKSATLNKKMNSVESVS